MRANAGIFIIIFLLLLVGTVAAANSGSISTSKDWVIADGSDHSTITVTALNSTGPVNGATVDFAVNDPQYGTLVPTTVTTGSTGIATSTFTVNKKSGTATITATITYPDGEPVTKTVTQNIDHDVLIPTFSYPSSVSAGQVIPFTVSIKDQWGNPIDNRRSDDTVHLSVFCPQPNDCGFVVANNHYFSVQPDSHGNVTRNIQIGTTSGINIITMDAILDSIGNVAVESQNVLIDAGANGPATLNAEVSPSGNPPTLPVNTGIFYFRYTVLDTFNNPVANQLIDIKTSDGQEYFIPTNADGQTPIRGLPPRDKIGNVIVTATTAALTNQFTVAYAASNPTDMALYVSPQSMGSLDYEPASQADVTARVIDNFGNPVSGQTIQFSLSPTTGTGWTTNPYLTTYTGTTDATGNVKTTFFPGTFNAANSDGSSILTAVWGSYPPQTVKLQWANHPYLTVTTTISNETPTVGDIINVSIKIVGNGKLNQFRPITVMLDQDTSSSMKNPSDTAGTREQAASAAATVFIERMDETNTQMGLETFGWDQNDITIGHLPIPSTFSHIEANLAILGGLGSSKMMEDSITISLNKIIAATNTPATEDNVKALILLSDGGSNLDNHNSLTTLVNTANAHGIYIYTISYLNGKGGEGTSQAFQEMEDLAVQTGGKHYSNKTAQGLNDIYLDIANQIQILAGKNTTMDVSFQDVSLTGIPPVFGPDVYNYIAAGTPVDLTPTVTNPNGRTSIFWPNLSQTIVNQSDPGGSVQNKQAYGQWPDLKFPVGAIDIDETWETVFSLQVKKAGTYRIFGPGSTITTETGTESPDLDKKQVVVSDPLDPNLKKGTLSLSKPETIPVNAPTFNSFIPLQWTTTYHGTSGTQYCN